MAGNSNVVSVDDYVRCEQLDGVVYDMPHADHRHGDININVGYAIKSKLLKGPCKVYIENLDLAYNQYNDDEKKRTDFLSPDVMIACDKSLLKGGLYYGVPKFVLETVSPSSVKRDRDTKFKIYEALGVSEYWIINPRGELLIYYLNDGKYYLKDVFMYCDDIESNDYNVGQVVALREFPNISMTLGDIFYT